MSEIHDNIENVELKKQMESAYLDYSMSVIVSRALPDVRDGLKPVHRRIIYGMQEQGLYPDRSFSKSARLVGEVMGKFHPHGDSAIYDAVVRLAQPFNLRYTLVEGQGNFGSIDGDGAAAPRYTELRMGKLALEMLRDINKNTVNFQDNYDGREQEPVVLPSRFPNLIVNGASGIAVGMATNMAPHNLKETIDACIAYIKNKDITITELMDYVKAPDFPTGGEIMGLSGVIQAYKTGRGKIILRAIAEIEEKKKKTSIIVTEIPYQVNKSNLIKKIAELVKLKKIEGISDLRDESDRKGMRIVIEIKKDQNVEVVLNNLYKYTQMQITFGIINLALVRGVPKVLSLKELIQLYIDHQIEVVTRRTEFDLKKAQDRAHIVEGLLRAIDHIDKIIHIIRTSYSDALDRLIEAFDFSEVQAQAILDMRLKRLQGLEKEKLEAEYKELLETINYLTKILENHDLLMEIITDELLEIREKFGDDRRSIISESFSEIDTEELIEKEEVLITLTNRGYIKRTPQTTYRVQNRGGKGIVGVTSKEEDFTENMIVANTHDQILFFTNLGKVFSKKAYEIPQASRTAKGTNIINLLQLEKGETVSQMMKVEETEKDAYILMMTKKGIGKKVSIDQFKNIRKVGIIAITLSNKDELITVKLANDEDNYIIVTKKGMSIRCEVKELRSVGRTAQGVKVITVKEDDEVVAFDIVEDYQFLLTVSENGYGKKTQIGKYTCQKRGGKGSKTYRITKKTGDIISAKLVQDENDIILVSKKGDIIRLQVKKISEQGKVTSGVHLKDTSAGEDEIVAVTKYTQPMEE